jgi:hypothetical protein
VANMNHDALNDLVVSNHKRGTVAVLINTTLGVTPPNP